MPYTITIKASARRSLAKLPKDVGERIARAIDSLAYQPRPSGCKKMEAEDDLWRIRVGDNRIVYQIHDDVVLVLVVRIGHRRDIYRK